LEWVLSEYKEEGEWWLLEYVMYVLNTLQH
jgi:hypothetical protein